MPVSDLKQTDQKFMQHALLLAERAELQGEVPVGALVVLHDRIIGEGWNQPITLHDPTAHAEIMALRDAASKIGNYRLPDTTLYVTLEPCPMCAGAIVHARVARVVYAATDPRVVRQVRYLIYYLQMKDLTIVWWSMADCCRQQALNC